MTGPFSLLVRRHLRDLYPSPWASLGEFLSVFADLLVFWYMAQAFGNAFSEKFPRYGSDYFSYAVIGQLTLAVPLTAVAAFSRVVRASIIDGTLDAFLVLPIRVQTPFLLSGLALLPRELVRIGLTLAIAHTVFGMHLPWRATGGAIALLCLAMPAFIGLGLLSAATIALFGRGTALLSHATVFASLAAGAFFPISVLPHGVQLISRYGSPFTVLLESVRQVIASNGASNGAGDGSNAFAGPASWAALAMWGLILFPAGYWVLGAGLRHKTRNGPPLLVVPS